MINDIIIVELNRWRSYKMAKKFNTTGLCVSKKHYMVDIVEKLKQIKQLIDDEAYFTINRGRQYGKTTTLSLLRRFLAGEYKKITLL